jgi:hypothetical protein
VSSTVLERHDEWEAVKLLGGSEGFLQLKLPPTLESQAGKDDIEKGDRRRRRSCGVGYVN